MYAIIDDGGRQYKVSEKDTLEVDLRELPDGSDKIEFDRVMLIGDENAGGATRIGQPWLEGAKVLASINSEVKGDKITIVKMKRRKGYHLKKGHRQRHLRVTIDKIVLPG